MRASVSKSETGELETLDEVSKMVGRPLGLRDTVVATLLSSARHELRSPLQSIQGFAELLDCGAYGPLSDDQHTFVKHILQGSSELGAMLEACLELTELALLGRPLELTREGLPGAITDALKRAERNCGVTVPLRIAAGAETLRARLDVSAMRRALEAVVAAVSAGGHLELTAELALDGEFARVSVGRIDASSTAPLRTLEELAQHRRACRSLVWLQLAATLITKHDGALLATDNGERAEVRLRLSSTH